MDSTANDNHLGPRGKLDTCQADEAHDDPADADERQVELRVDGEKLPHRAAECR